MRLKNSKKCHAHNRDGSSCQGDAVKGKNVCRMHGANAGRPPTTYKNIGTNLSERIEQLKHDPELLQAERGVRTATAMLELLERHISALQDKGEIDTEQLIRIGEAVNSNLNTYFTGQKAIATIEHSNVLTAKEYTSFSEGINYTVKELNARYGDAGEHMITLFERYSVLKNATRKHHTVKELE